MVGTTISGRYQVEKQLGEGGMGAVYLVQHTAMRKRFALKVLNSKTAQLPEMVARFEREAMAAAHVEHPNITVAVDFGKTDDGALYLVLEYLEGQRLRDAIAGPLELRRALHIARQIASALERSHELGVIHRDLKPENIMLVSRQGDRDFVKVLDFGLAKVAMLEPGTKAPAQALTKHGTIFGTPKYMAPEQCVGGAVDGRADLYALGLILFEMLTGVQAFAGQDALRTITLQLTAPTPSMKVVAPAVTVPASLEAVVQRLTEKQPESRYKNATEVLSALAQVAEKEGLLAQVVTTTPLGLQALAVTSSSSGSKTIESVDVLSEEPLSAVEVSTPEAKHIDSARATKETPGNSPPPLLHTHAPSEAAPKRPVPEVAKPQLLLLRNRLPVFLQNVPPLLLVAAPVVVVVVGVVLLLALHSGDSIEQGTRSGRSSHLATATQVQIQQASSSGIPALATLAEQYPQDAQVRLIAAQQLLAQDNGLDALRWMGKALAIDPNCVPAAEARQATMLALSKDSGSTETVIALLETRLGSIGFDILYALASQPGQSRQKVALLNQSMAKPEVRRNASAAALITQDLRTAEQCDAKHGLLKKAAELGDRRTLEQLRRLTLTRNCGPLGLVDCWPCLRQDGALPKAIASIEARTIAGK